MPVVIGVLFGAMAGAKVLVKTDPKKLRLFFACLIIVLAINMIYNGINGKI